jgi:hypothetical protein
MNARESGEIAVIEGTRKSDTVGMLAQRELSQYEYEFLKSFLYAAYSGRYKDEKLVLTRCVAHSSLSHRPQHPSVYDTGSGTFPVVGDGVLEVTAQWQGGTYEINVSKELIDSRVRVHTAYCLALSSIAIDPAELLEYCLDQAVRNSYLKNHILHLSPLSVMEDAIQIKPVEVPGRPLEEILLPRDTIDAVKLFIEAVRSYDQIRKPLRYLLSGKPGTGKTEVIRSMIEACRNRATFLIVEAQTNLLKAFELASLFSPSVLLLDDIDLICGDRNRHNGSVLLGGFLTLMDGFETSDTFVLATTNDKQWVDIAVSRPGRFDLVLDLETLNPELYRNLIHQRMTDKSLLPLFDDSVVELMQRKKVSAAFVVNLLKHLQIRNALVAERIDIGYVLRTIVRMHNGFEKIPKKERSLGFEPN